jgi:hypothetical protein
MFNIIRPGRVAPLAFILLVLLLFSPCFAEENPFVVKETGLQYVSTNGIEINYCAYYTDITNPLDVPFYIYPIIEVYYAEDGMVPFMLIDPKEFVLLRPNETKSFAVLFCTKKNKLPDFVKKTIVGKKLSEA